MRITHEKQLDNSVDIIYLIVCLGLGSGRCRNLSLLVLFLGTIDRANAAQVLGCLNYSSCSPVVRAKDRRLLGLVIRTIKNLNIWEVQHMYAMHKKKLHRLTGCTY